MFGGSTIARAQVQQQESDASRNYFMAMRGYYDRKGWQLISVRTDRGCITSVRVEAPPHIPRVKRINPTA